MEKAGNILRLPEGTTPDDYFFEDGRWVFKERYRDIVRGAGVGDINSNVKGSAARYNSGKPDLSQFDLRLLCKVRGPSEPNWVYDVLNDIGAFQMAKLEERDRTPLQSASLLHALGSIPDAFRSAARVFSYGEKKYARYNWMKGQAWSIPIACIGRHALAVMEGEDTDPESGEPHAGHIACNIIMLLHYIDHYEEGDDRPCKPD